MQLSPVQIRDRPIKLDYFRSLSENYDFETVNSSRGREIVSGRQPGAEYVLPEGKLGLFEYETGFRELLHPFRPSGNILVEFEPSTIEADIRLYLSGDEQAFRELDQDLLDRIDSLDSDYKKQII